MFLIFFGNFLGVARSEGGKLERKKFKKIA
jgi:hypothetical protein